ncbi:MAG: hypothetical protein PHP69_00935 [Candidatus Omnitrophica bacterium]|nr:hypothetical protein [Candidatus Omnitrophota bacterium]MDD5080973.1 hypothetical protein [Candidatus Omnitrophota bacterium]MDD5440616.1 hypothetical protein [Candidatus Omnitrophota bacterium]
MSRKVSKKSVRKKPVAAKKAVSKSKATKTITLKLTGNQWAYVNKWSDKANLIPSEYVKKILLDFLNIE